MTVPRPDELTAHIADEAGVDADTVSDVLAGQGVSLVPVPPAQRRVDIRRLSFKGEKVNTQWAGPFDAVFDFNDGVTALITDENLRGKSTVLELITWALRGSPRDELRADVRPWFQRIALEYSVNGTPMAVVLTKEQSGVVADIFRADTAESLRRHLEGTAQPGDVHLVASELSAQDFRQQQDQQMLTQLDLEPISNFQRHAGSDQGRPVTHSWPAYFGGVYLPGASSDILFGETSIATLPARILQMYCNVPLMGAFIRLTTLSRHVKQGETNQGRRLAEDAAARAAQRGAVAAELAAVNERLAGLPSAKGRSFDAITAELVAAENELATAVATQGQAARTFDDAKADRQSEEFRANNRRETELALMLFQGLAPKRCPRCEQGIGVERTELEVSEHQCAVCTKEIAVNPNDTGDNGEPEELGNALEALKEAEAAAERTVQAAAADVAAARQRVDALSVELSEASHAKEYSERTGLQLERARLAGALSALPQVGVALEPTESLRVLEAATSVLRDVTRDAASELFAELNEEIVGLGRKFGIANLEAVQLNRSGGMKVWTAGEETSFHRVSGGERLRLRVAVVIALLRIGHRRGVGSHPGLILLDSPGSDELTVDDEATLVRELDSLKDELPGLQVVIASAEPAAVQGQVPNGNIYASLNGDPLW